MWVYLLEIREGCGNKSKIYFKIVRHSQRLFIS